MLEPVPLDEIICWNDGEEFWKPISLSGQRNEAALTIFTYTGELVIVTGFSSRMGARNSANAALAQLARVNRDGYGSVLGKLVSRWRRKGRTVEIVGS